MAKNSEISDRIRQIRLKFFEGSNRKMAEKIGINEDYFGRICSGKVGVGRSVVDRILAAMPEVNGDWLLTGVGSIVVGSSDNSDNGPVGRGSLEEEVRRLEEIVNKQAEQIDRLLKIIESLTKSSTNV